MNPETDTYFIPRSSAEASFLEKRSRFIGRVFPIHTEDDAVSILRDLKRTYWDATHHCYAYVLREPMLTRHSDHGEPQGTAGLPILSVLQHAKAFNLLCVVTRYFGGILLGTGGLTRAYTKAAQLAVDAAGLVALKPCQEVLFSCPYDLYDATLRLVEACGGVVGSSDFAAEVALTVLLPAPATDAFLDALTQLSTGRLAAKKAACRWYPL